MYLSNVPILEDKCCTLPYSIGTADANGLNGEIILRRSVRER